MQTRGEALEREVDGTGITTTTLRQTVGILAGVLGPVAAKGLIVRRPWVVALAERLDLDRRAVAGLHRLRDRYGTAPLRLRIPFRTAVVLLDPADVRRVLDGTPDPFTSASREKRAALRHLEPEGVIISDEPERADRRRLNEAVLRPELAVHPLGQHILTTVRAEVDEVLTPRPAGATFRWDDLALLWWRIVRRVVLGDGARDDHEVTDLVLQLRGDANWAYLRPRRPAARHRLDRRLAAYVAAAEPDSLAQLVAATPAPLSAAPVGQIPQWLFAFDEGAHASALTLALLATHPGPAARARAEVSARQPGVPAALPFLRACVLEALRLWPTNPVVLRDTTEATAWGAATLPARSSIVIYAPALHRDERHGAAAHRFTPGLWLTGGAPRSWSLIPFSAGPAVCPGQSLVQLVVTTLLAEILGRGEVALDPPGCLDPERPLPGTLSPFRLRFRIG